MVNEFKINVTNLGLEDKVTVIHDDLVEFLKLSSSVFNSKSIIVIYLLPEALEVIKSYLLDSLKQGAVVICNTWGPKGWKFADKISCGSYSNVILLKYNENSLNNITDN